MGGRVTLLALGGVHSVGYRLACSAFFAVGGILLPVGFKRICIHRLFACSSTGNGGPPSPVEVQLQLCKTLRRYLANFVLAIGELRGRVAGRGELAHA